MNDDRPGIPLATAQTVADVIRGAMAYRCEWDAQSEIYLAAIVGSIRRGKERVKDIELVVVPYRYQEPDPTDVLQERQFERSQLYREWAIGQSVIEWIKPGTDEIIPWNVKEDGKYWRGYIRSLATFGVQANLPEPLPDQGCKVDIFLCHADNFGLHFLLRTGSAEFSAGVALHANRVGYKIEDGALWRLEGKRSAGKATRLNTPTEIDVFRELNLQWVAPADRRTADDLHGGWDEDEYTNWTRSKTNDLGDFKRNVGGN